MKNVLFTKEAMKFTTLMEEGHVNRVGGEQGGVNITSFVEMEKVTFFREFADAFHEIERPLCWKGTDCALDHMRLAKRAPVQEHHLCSRRRTKKYVTL